MIRFAFAQVIAHRVRLALTVIAVLLGVAFVTGALVLSGTAQKLFDEQFATAAAGVDVTVRTATAFDSGMGVEVERDPLPADVLARVADAEGVTAAVPVAKGAARLARDGADLGSVQLSTWVDEPTGAYPLLEGRAPAAADEIVVDRAAAGTLGLRIGDEVEVLGDGRTAARIVGLVGFGDGDGPPVGVVVLSTLAGAQHALGMGDGISEVLVTSDLPVARLQPLLTDALGDAVQVATAQDLAAAGREQAASSLQMLQVVLVALSIASLVIGSFLIANTFTIVIAHRTRELALVRAVGATAAQVRTSVLVEALVVGVVASAAGAAAGVLGAHGLRGLARTFGVLIPDGDLVVEPGTVLLALGIGIAVTVGAALAPAARAAAVSPLAALRASAAEAPHLGRARVGAGAVLVALGTTAAAAPAFGGPLVLLGGGLVAALAGIVLVAPLVLRPLVSAIGGVASRHLTGQLAREAALRSPRRTATTAMALALGLAMLTFVSVVGASVKTATGAQYREVVSADAVVESAGQEMLGGVHAAVFDEIAEVAEVGSVSRLKYGHWRDGETTSALTAFDPASIGEVAAIRMTMGDLSALEAGGVAIAERVARDRSLSIGDELPMTFARTGERALTVVGVVEDGSAQALQTDYFVSLRTYAGLYTEDMDASVFVRAADGVAPARLAAALESALADHPSVQVRDQAAVVAGRTQAVDQIFGLVSVLLAFALLIAALGVANTLALSIAERTREIGLLRAIGMGQRAVARMVRIETGIVCVVAGLLGSALGLAASAAGVAALSAVAPLHMVIPWPQIIVVAAVVVAAGLLAGVLPARRAARVPVLEATAHV